MLENIFLFANSISTPKRQFFVSSEIGLHQNNKMSKSIVGLKNGNNKTATVKKFSECES